MRSSLIVRERLTGAPPPETAKAMVDLWRPWIEERAGRTLSRMDKLADDQETFGRQLRDLLKALDLSEELSEGEREEGEDDERGARRAATQNAEEQRRRPGRPGPGRATTSAARARRARPPRPAQDADADQFDADADGEEMADAREPWRPNYQRSR